NACDATRRSIPLEDQRQLRPLDLKAGAAAFACSANRKVPLANRLARMQYPGAIPEQVPHLVAPPVEEPDSLGNALLTVPLPSRRSARTSRIRQGCASGRRDLARVPQRHPGLRRRASGADPA